MAISDDDIRWLFSLLESEGLAEIELRAGEDETLVRRLEAATLPAAFYAGDGAAVAEAAIAASEPALPENVVPVVAPMSGVYYRAPSPESPPYVEVGQLVEAGDTIGLIEAMKLFNDVAASVTGTVLQLLTTNEQHVETGQTLVLIQT
jgi:acetyl-CoA carboxylase biotin carboxyl carrier protein